MDPNYSRAYRELYQRHWWWRARTELIVQTLREIQPPQGWENILDIGCGNGLFFERLSEFGRSEFGSVEGVEPAVELISGDNPNRDRIYICPFDESFQPRKNYSLILMLDVLEHMENPTAALRHALHVLSPDGALILTVPAFQWLWGNHDVMNHHFRRYTKHSFRKEASEAGLEIVRERYFYHWLFPVKFTAGILERIFKSNPRLPKIPSPPINEILFRLSRAEQKMSSSMPVPFGTSLLIVGRKRKAG